ncbi:hypothetical protein EI94DRAFT_1786674 [Lactarius quietus]|nr:hypothetical protein EI94DRAFT_1786674 [Lactarius quietus]
MMTSCQWIFNLTPSSLLPSHRELQNTSDSIMHISLRNHTYACSFLVDLSTDSSELPEALLHVGVTISSDARTHEIRIETPANSREALAATTISAFRTLNRLIVHADSYEFRIKFSPHEVDVAAASALVDDNGVLIIRVRRLSSWLYRLQSCSLVSA